MTTPAELVLLVMKSSIEGDREESRTPTVRNFRCPGPKQESKKVDILVPDAPRKKTSLQKGNTIKDNKRKNGQERLEEKKLGGEI